MACSHCCLHTASGRAGWSECVHGAPVESLIALWGPAAVSKGFSHLPNPVFWSPRFFISHGAPGLLWVKKDWVFSVDWVFFSSELCALLFCLCVGLEEGFMFLKCITGGPFHSGAVYLEVASISKLRLNDLVVDDSYIKWSVELNPDFF